MANTHNIHYSEWMCNAQWYIRTSSFGCVYTTAAPGTFDIAIRVSTVWQYIINAMPTLKKKLSVMFPGLNASVKSYLKELMF